MTVDNDKAWIWTTFRTRSRLNLYKAMLGLSGGKLDQTATLDTLLDRAGVPDVTPEQIANEAAAVRND